MPEVVVIRPGCTDFDEQNRIQGSLELPPNSRGLRQIQQLVAQLADVPLEMLYSDPSEPARSTAEAIAEELGVPVKLLDELKNLDQGLWQGLRVDDVRHKYPKAYKQWQESPETICPPQGETVAEATARVRKALRKPLKKWDAFAVVAAEPLASLIAAVVRNDRLEIPEPKYCCTAEPRVEFLHADDHLDGHGVAPHPVKEVATVGPSDASAGRNGEHAEDAP
jgi:probable phosphoglycerate mutase